MSTQLNLIEEAGGQEWRLDARTREVGRKGVAAARAALRATRRRGEDDDPTASHPHAA